MNKTDINEIFYVEKDYSKIKEKLKFNFESWSFDILAKIALQECDIECAYNFYEKAENLEGCAYCKIIKGDYLEAEIILRLIKNSSPFAQWLFAMLMLIQKREDIFVSYFEIRNFLEQDLDIFIKYGQFELINKIISNLQYLEMFNKEVYKYVARVFINNFYRLDLAKKFLDKSLNIFYKDSETHFLYGEFYLLQKDYVKALNSFKKSIIGDCEYSPAEKKIKYLSELLSLSSDDKK